MACWPVAGRMTISQAFIQKTVETKEARHHIGEPGFLKAFTQHGAYRRLAIGWGERYLGSMDPSQSVRRYRKTCGSFTTSRVR